MSPSWRTPRMSRAWKAVIATAVTATLGAAAVVSTPAGAFVTISSAVAANKFRSAVHTDLGVYGLAIEPAEGTVLRKGDDATVSLRSNPNPTSVVSLAVEAGDVVAWNITVPEELEIVECRGGTATDTWYETAWSEGARTCVYTMTFLRASATVPTQNFTVDVTARASIPAGADVTAAITLPERFASVQSSQSAVVPTPDIVTFGIHNLTFTPDSGAPAIRPDHGVRRGVLAFDAYESEDGGTLLSAKAGDVFETRVTVSQDLVADFNFRQDSAFDVTTRSIEVGGRREYTITRKFRGGFWDWRPVRLEMGLTLQGIDGAAALADIDLIEVEQTLPERFDSAHLRAETFVPYIAPGLIPFTQVATGGSHVLALAEDGTLFSWGNNYYGQLGDDSRERRVTPAPVALLDGKTFKAVAAGEGSSLALTTDGEVYFWGARMDADVGYIVQGTPRKKSIPGNAPIEAIATGGKVAFAISESGDLFAWGDNSENQGGLELGSGTVVSATQVDLPQPVSEVYAGLFSTIVRLADGSYMGMGSNTRGTLGMGNQEDQPLPVALPELTGRSFTQIALSRSEGQAITADGDLYRWGTAVSASLVPTLMSKSHFGDGISPVQLRSTCTDGLLVIGSDGGVYRGDLDGGVTRMPAPSQLRLATVDGCASYIGVTAYGTAFGYGLNGDGQLGIGHAGVAVDILTAVLLPTVSSAAAIRDAGSEVADDVTADEPLLNDGGSADGHEVPADDADAADAPDGSTESEAPQTESDEGEASESESPRRNGAFAGSEYGERS